jgi:hypothetical protein
MTTEVRARAIVGGWIARIAHRPPGADVPPPGTLRPRSTSAMQGTVRPRPAGRSLEGERSPGDRPGFWRELAIVALFYGIYTALRDLQGVGKAARAVAIAHALDVVSTERVLGIFHERAVQRAFLGDRALVMAMDDYYDLAHFALTIAVLVALWTRWPMQYRRARNALALTTAIALLVFAFFPEAPPRLLPARFGFVDTLHTVGGFLSLQSPEVAKLSDPYAAMPSLHFAWALWCALAAGSVLRRRWLRALLLAYPALTLWVVIVTANHFFLDVVAGGVVVGFSWWATDPRRRWVGSELRDGAAARGTASAPTVPRQRVGTEDASL